MFRDSIPLFTEKSPETADNNNNQARDSTSRPPCCLPSCTTNEEDRSVPLSFFSGCCFPPSSGGDDGLHVREVLNMATRGAFQWTLVWLCLSAVRSSEAIKSYYDILDVEQTASESQIKKSFRRLAVRYHPDKNKSADSETIFRDIAEAYSVLSDKEKRRLYDTVGHEAFLDNEASVDPEHEHDEHEHDPDVHFSFSHFFQDLDDFPFEEEPHNQWRFFEDEEFVFEHGSFQGSDFSFYFEDTDENEDVYLH